MYVPRNDHEVKHSKRSSLCRSCFIVSTASVLLGVLSFFGAVSFCIYLCVLASSECSRMGGPGPRSSDRIFFKSVTKKTYFHKSLWQTQIIRSPGHRSACCMPLHSNEARTHGRMSKLEYRSFVYDRRSTDARAVEVPRSLWKQKISRNK